MRILLLGGLIVGMLGGICLAEDPVFSGPQVGEPLPFFTMRGVLGDKAGQELDLVKQAGEGPLALIFVHKRTRPSVGLARVLADYAAKLEGVTCGVVFLEDDLTKTEQWMKIAQHALPKKAAVGLSPEGAEGPGAYGLNRNVTMTILVGKQAKTTANFALVQPSLQADAVKIAAAVAQAAGVDPPTLKELAPPQAMRRPQAKRRPAAARPDANQVDLRPLLTPVIAKQATPEQVAQAAAAVEKKAGEDEAFRRRLGVAAKRIIDAGKLENYGTPAAQKYLQKWAREFSAPDPPASAKDNDDPGR